MTWNEISDGQPGLALPAMQNWRHAGRFNSDMVPLDNSGNTLTTGLLNLGTAGAPYANAYLATGGALYIGGTEFEGGGGGSAVEVFEQQSHIEKIGYKYPLSNPQSLSESFTDDSAMVVTLGKTHLLTETTIYLDRDAASISAIDEASATAWTPVGTGTTATNTTAGQSVDGVSVTYAVTATNTTYYMAHSFTAFSMTDKDLKVWLYPDTVANVTSAMIRLYSAATTTGFAEWQIPVASLTALSLNSLYLDVDNPTTSGAAYVRSLINYVALGLIGSATPQAINWSWDKIRSVDNRALKIPVQMVCDNNTNQEFINVNSTTVAGDVYTLDTTTTYTHTISSTEIKLKQLDIEHNYGIIASGTSGDAALIGWDISRKYFDTTTTGDLVITSRWYDEDYEVATVTNASTTVLTVDTTTVAAGILSGDVVRLYKWEYIDQDYQSPYNASIGSNFLDLTLTANAGTTSSTELTLTHANTSNQNLGGDSADKWRGIRISADDYYRVESATQSQSLIKATTDSFIRSVSYVPFPTDYIRNYWLFDETTAIAPIDFLKTDNLTQNGSVPSSKLVLSGGRGEFTTANYFSEASLDLLGDTTFAFGGWFICSTTGVNQAILSRTSNAINNGNAFNITSGNVLSFVDYGTATLNGTTNVCDGLLHRFFVCNRVVSGANELRIYLDGNLEAQTTGQPCLVIAVTPTIGKDSHAASGHFQGILRALEYWDSVPSTWSFIEKNEAELMKFNFYGDNTGYIQKSTINDVSGNKLIAGTRLTRNDATNQNPKAFQRNAVIT